MLGPGYPTIYVAVDFSPPRPKIFQPQGDVFWDGGNGYQVPQKWAGW